MRTIRIDNTGSLTPPITALPPMLPRATTYYLRGVLATLTGPVVLDVDGLHVGSTTHPEFGAIVDKFASALRVLPAVPTLPPETAFAQDLAVLLGGELVGDATAEDEAGAAIYY